MPTRPCLWGIYKQEAFHIFPHQVCLLKKSSLTVLYHKRTEAQKVCINSSRVWRSFRFESNPAVSFCPFYNIFLGDQSAVPVVQSPALSKTLLFSSNEECPKGGCSSQMMHQRKKILCLSGMREILNNNQWNLVKDALQPALKNCFWPLRPHVAGGLGSS